MDSYPVVALQKIRPLTLASRCLPTSLNQGERPTHFRPVRQPLLFFPREILQSETLQPGKPYPRA
jgi:hypothetical protein